MAIPAGTIFAWAGNVDAIPKGYLPCDGTSYKRNQWPELFAAIGAIWGGDAADNFKVPDLRGRFLRGVDRGAGRDFRARDRRGDDGRHIGDATGSVQTDALQTHRHDDLGHAHTFEGLQRQDNDDDQANDARSLWSIDHVQVHSTRTGHAVISAPTNLTDANPVRAEEETRPKNAYVEFIIKATNAA